MNATTPRPLVQINTLGLRALVQALGAADAARFLHQFGSVRGDYTAERDAWLGEMDVADAAGWVRQRVAQEK